MKRPRIALVVPVFPVRSETFIVSHAVGLVEAGWDAHIVCGRVDKTLLRSLPERARTILAGRVHAAWPHRPRALAAMLLPLSVFYSLVRQPAAAACFLARGGSLKPMYLEGELIRLAPKLIHFEFGAIARGRIAIGQRLGASTVVSFRGYDLAFVGLDDPAHYAEVWKRADALHFLGEDLWRRALRRGCPPTKPHALIAPAIDSEFFDPGERSHAEAVGSKDRPLRILSVGRLEWKKGYEYALSAVRNLLDRGIACEYHIVGAGEFYTATAYARYQLGLVDCTTMMGARSASEVRDEMRWADVMLHAAVSEGFGNAVMEAQAMMLPVVCTTADGLRENVEDGRTGFVVPTRDPVALAGALARLAADPDLRTRMGAAGRTRVIAKFALADQAAAFTTLYERVLASPRRG